MSRIKPEKSGGAPARGRDNEKVQHSTFVRHSFIWVTLLLFLLSAGAHWLLAWLDFKAEQLALGQQPEMQAYWIQLGRETMENWQSEFLQLIWQVAGLSFLLHIGSPQSREGMERMEEKVDYLLKKIDPAGAESFMDDVEGRLPKH